MAAPVPLPPVPVPGACLRVSPEEVEAAWDRLAEAVTGALTAPGVPPGNGVLLGVLMGGAVPLVRISERVRADVTLETCRVSRYGHDTRGGEIRWLAPPGLSLEGRDVIVVDDVFDEGWTLAFVADRCRDLGARSVRLAVLVHKTHPRTTAPLRPDFMGLTLGDEYLFGCGMDYQGRWRHLPAIYGLPGA